MNRLYIILLWSGVATLSLSCQSYLDVKSDQNMVIPQKLDDLQAILNNVAFINAGYYPGLAEISTDDFYLNEASYLAISEFERTVYRWDTEPLYTSIDLQRHWGGPYVPVLMMNLILEEVKKLSTESPIRAEQITASARFFRAFSFQMLADVFGPPYQLDGDNKELGIPLRTSSDVEVASQRATVQQTYDFIVKEITDALEYLPEVTAYPSQPTKRAGHALLARVYLIMGEYEKALEHTSEIFKENVPLMDYAFLDKNSSIPVNNKNEEVIFYAYSFGGTLLSPSLAIVSSDLLDLYNTEDLRLAVFFKEQKGAKVFKGGYHGAASSSFFVGLATDEVYLIHAECLARLGDIKQAVHFLNQLRAKRFDQNSFVPIELKDKIEIIHDILDERRRELPFRGLRWSDLRRLNQQAGFEKTIRRNITIQNTSYEFELGPNDKRYTMLIPQEVITITGMSQNPR